MTRSDREALIWGMTLYVTFLLLLGVFILWSLIPPAHSTERYADQYKDTPPHIQQWYKDQKSPATGGLCCNEADGVSAEEDIRQGHYWTRWGSTPWMPVPDEVVINTPNPTGAAVVWWFVQQQGNPGIRCFAPGAKM